MKGEGELFCTVSTVEAMPLNMQVIFEMIAEQEFISKILNFFGTDVYKALGVSYPSKDEYIAMLNDAGFEIILFEDKVLKRTFRDLQAIHDHERPISTSRPLTKWLSQSIFSGFYEKLYDGYIAKIIEKCERGDDGSYTYPAVPSTSVIYARKKGV